MSDENVQTPPAQTHPAMNSNDASTRKEGAQFIIKMLFLAFIVIAIVFYVRSLDHKPGNQAAAPAQETAEPAQTSAQPVPEPLATTAVVAEQAGEPAAQPETPTATSSAPKAASQPAPQPAPEPAQEAAQPQQEQAAVTQQSQPEASAPPVQTAPLFRPLEDEDAVMRQIQEVFAPETLHQ